MAQMPVEIIEVGDLPTESITVALSLANSLQKEFVYNRLPETEAQPFQVYAFNRIKAEDFMDSMEQVRNSIRGYHPFLLAFVDAELDGKDYGNIFGSNRAKKGVGVCTVSNVAGVILQPGKMHAYFLYYLARYTLSYIATEHKNHDDTRGCIYDRKVNKLDILESMKARAFCDECRSGLLTGEYGLSPRQFNALDKMFEACGNVLQEGQKPKAPSKRLRTFIGSSTEGLPIANKLQMLLDSDLAVEVWNQGTVFGLGDVTLEALERAVLSYDFGIFVFTPDDELHTRGESKPVARDNVVFELGLFIGKLTRRRAFVIHPSKRAITLPSDLSGITTANYDPDNSNIAAALGPACERIRDAVVRASSV
jgi:predicted nucleotide-binding protein